MGRTEDVAQPAVAERRDVVFVVIAYRPFCSMMCQWNCVGVFDDLDVAKRETVRFALRGLHDFSAYDPAQRYVESDVPLDDRWPRTSPSHNVGVYHHRIEAWSLDTGSRTEALSINLDAHIKRTIARDGGMSSSEARRMLQGWQRDPPHDALTRLFSPILEPYVSDPETDAAAWVERHGYGAGYRTYDPLFPAAAEEKVAEPPIVPPETRRDIFVLISSSTCWANARECMCVGVFDDLDAAKPASVRHALQNIHTWGAYDPAHRYRGWDTMRGVDDYRIETWSLNTTGYKQWEEEARPLRFHLDTHIKRTIARDGLSFPEARLMLQGWQRGPPHDALMPIFSTEWERQYAEADSGPGAHAE